MKRLFKNLIPMAMLAVLPAACTTEKETVTGNFPDLVSGVFNLDEDGGNILTVSIEPNMAWTVSIPAESSSEFGIVDGESVVTSMGGQAGSYEVQVICLLEEADLEEHSVTVSMTMGSETREIAKFFLYSTEKTFNIYRVVTDENGKFVEAAADSGFSYEYEEIPEGESVPMFWSVADNAYVTYLQVEANFTTTVPAPEGLSVEEIYSLGSLTEYRVVCSTVNFTEDAGVEYTFTVNSEVEGYESNSCTLNAPKFEPIFEIYAAVADDSGENFKYGTTYSWEYEALDENAEVALLFRPEFSAAVDNYLLVKANFTVEFSDVPGWLEVGDAQLQESTSTDDYLENVYHISADPTADSFEVIAQDENLTISFGELSYSYTVSHSDLSEILYVIAGSFNFDDSGTYLPGEMTTAQNAEVSVVSAESLTFYYFELRSNGFYYTADWINASASAWACLQSSTVTIKVDANSGDARTGIVVALPASLASGITDPEFDLFNSEGTALNQKYSDYLIATVSQTGSSSQTIEPLDSQYWSYFEGISVTFGELESSDFICEAFPGVDAYVFSYVIPEWPSYDFGAEICFAINTEWTGYEVVDGTIMDYVTDTDNYWAKLAKSDNYDDGYYISMEYPGTGEMSSYFVFFNGGTAVAIVKVEYSSGGDDDDFTVSWYSSAAYGCTLEKLDSHYLGSDYTDPCWQITYTGDSEGTFCMLSIPTGSYYITNGFDAWMESSYAGGMLTIDIVPSNRTDTSVTEGYLRIMSMETWSYVCTIVVKLNITD